jgi:hypothetical protein
VLGENRHHVCVCRLQGLSPLLPLVRLIPAAFLQAPGGVEQLVLIAVFAEPLRAAGYVPLHILRTFPSSSRHYIEIVNFPLHSLTNTSRRSGNDAPEDEQPTKAPRQVVKNTTSTKKQDEKPAAAGASRGKQGARRGYSGNEGGEQAQFSLCLQCFI